MKDVINIKRINHVTDTSLLETQIDRLVYHAYELLSDDIKIIEQSL